MLFIGVTRWFRRVFGGYHTLYYRKLHSSAIGYHSSYRHTHEFFGEVVYGYGHLCRYRNGR